MDEGVLRGMAAMGASEQDIAAARAQMAPEDAADGADGAPVFEVWPENWDVLMLFLSLADQWAYAGGGMGPTVRTGLPANRVESALRLGGWARARWAAVYEDIRAMSHAVASADAETAREAAGKGGAR